MLNLFRAEWLKARKRPANRALACLVLGILLIAFAAATAIAWHEGGEGSTSTRERMAFPNGFRLPLLVLGALGPVLGIVFTATSVGSEYGGDTWKALLPRRGSRTGFILAKLAAGLCFMLALIGVTLLAGQGLGLLGAAVLGGQLIGPQSFSPLELLRSLAPVLLEIIVFATITLLATVLSRSTVLGIVFGVVGVLTFGVAAGLSTFAARVLPTTHLSNLQARWLHEGAEQSRLLAQAASSFGMEVSAAVSTAVVVGYVVGCVALSLRVFQRRDVAGQ